MRSTISLAGIIAFLLFAGCKEFSPFETTGLGEAEITGYQARDQVGNQIFTVGIPNNRNCLPYGNEFCRQVINAFPNPSQEQVSVFIGSMGSSKTPARLSLVRAQPSPALLTSEFRPGLTIHQDGPAFYSPQDIILEAGANTIGLDISDIPPGFYRLYLQMEDAVLWDNILILPAEL